MSERLEQEIKRDAVEHFDETGLFSNGDKSSLRREKYRFGVAKQGPHSKLAASCQIPDFEIGLKAGTGNGTSVRGHSYLFDRSGMISERSQLITSTSLPEVVPFPPAQIRAL